MPCLHALTHLPFRIGNYAVAGGVNKAVPNTRLLQIPVSDRGRGSDRAVRSVGGVDSIAMTGPVRTEIVGDFRADVEWTRSGRRVIGMKTGVGKGTGTAKVTGVEIVESTHTPMTGAVGFDSELTWTVTGSVGHWGHVHQRKNQYRARLTVEAADGRWRITSLDLLEEERRQ